jgi:hypothetical protein
VPLCSLIAHIIYKRSGISSRAALAPKYTPLIHEQHGGWLAFLGSRVQPIITVHAIDESLLFKARIPVFLLPRTHEFLQRDPTEVVGFVIISRGVWRRLFQSTGPCAACLLAFHLASFVITSSSTILKEQGWLVNASPVMAGS